MSFGNALVILLFKTMLYSLLKYFQDMQCGSRVSDRACGCVAFYLHLWLMFQNNMFRQPMFLLNLMAHLNRIGHRAHFSGMALVVFIPATPG